MSKIQKQVKTIGWFLYDKETKMVCLHRRDNKVSESPNTWDHFGGKVEKGAKETVYEAFLRELCEELGITTYKNKVKKLSNSKGKKMYYIPFSVNKIKEIRLGEGAGFAFFPLNVAVSLTDLTEVAKDQLNLLQKKLNQGTQNLKLKKRK